MKIECGTKLFAKTFVFCFLQSIFYFKVMTVLNSSLNENVDPISNVKIYLLINLWAKTLQF